MVTPRGYTNKYTWDGEAIAGQTPGRSLVVPGALGARDDPSEEASDGARGQAGRGDPGRDRRRVLPGRQHQAALRLGAPPASSRRASSTPSRGRTSASRASGPLAVPGPWLDLAARLRGRGARAPAGAAASLIERNGSVSERLWRLVMRADPDGDEPPAEAVVDARWLGEMPAPSGRSCARRCCAVCDDETRRRCRSTSSAPAPAIRGSSRCAAPS